MSKLGLDGSFTQAVSLIEWAERLEDLTPSVRLDVYITTAGGSRSAGGGGGVGGVTGGHGGADVTTVGTVVAPEAGAAAAAAEAAGATLVTCEAGEEEEVEDEDEDVDPAFLDRQPRLIRLEPRGGEWRQRIDALMSSL
jgi:hypothetical protein